MPDPTVWEFMKAFFLGKTEFEREWWYVKEYIRLLMLFPILIWGLQRMEAQYHQVGGWKSYGRKYWLWMIICLVLFFLVRARDPWGVIFFTGILCAKYRFFDRLDMWIHKTKYPQLIIAAFTLTVAIKSGFHDSEKEAIFILPFFIYGFSICVPVAFHFTMNHSKKELFGGSFFIALGRIRSSIATPSMI